MLLGKPARLARESFREEKCPFKTPANLSLPPWPDYLLKTKSILIFRPPFANIPSSQLLLLQRIPVFLGDKEPV